MKTSKLKILIVDKTLNGAEWKALDILKLSGNEMFKKVRKNIMKNDLMEIYLSSLSNVDSLHGTTMDLIFIHKSVNSEQMNILKWIVKGPKDIYYFEE